MEKVTKIYIGVDVAKNFLVICLNPINKIFQVNNTDKDINNFFQIEISKYDVQQIVCESSGGYEHILMRVAHKFGYHVWQVEPQRIKAFIASEGMKAKNDKIDAKMIALFAAVKNSKYKRQAVTEEDQKLRAYIKRRNDLIDMISMEKKRMKHPQEHFFKKDIQRHINHMEKELEKLNIAIQQIINENASIKNKVALMESVPGVGKITAAALAANMQELGRVNNKEIAALIGVAPYTKQSGTYVGNAFIGGGRPAPRRALYMAALTASRSNPVLSKFYQRLLKAGKKPKVAIVAVMRKLITIINVMIKNNEVWRTA